MNATLVDADTDRMASYKALDLQCPRCRAGIHTLECEQCGLSMRGEHGIMQALPPERADAYARFISDYETIRAAEGRGSVGDAYYLGLPYDDATGRNQKQWRIRAKSFDYLTRKILLPIGRGGRVLDIGAGNCWMSFRLAREGYRPAAVDLLTNSSDGLAAAAHYEKYLPEPIPRFQAEMTRLPFRGEQFDAVVFNASFHYAQDYEATLREALRCLRMGGLLVISDTPWYSSGRHGERMIAERQTAYLRRYGTASASLASLEFLTDERLNALATNLSLRWQVHKPFYGLSWQLRPLIAKWRGHREPSRFRIYVATRDE